MWQAIGLKELQMPSFRIITDKPVAYESLDHQMPYGTALNNSFRLRFNIKLGWCIPPNQWRLLDIGCAGGGFVRSILEQGGFAIGVEGSDYSQRHKRAEWATIPDHLFTADATVPFQLVCTDADIEKPLLFNVITGWEFLEHIPESKIDGVVENVRRHLAPQGMAIFSINDEPSVVNGVELHQTRRPKPWWIEKFKDLGFSHHEEMIPFFAPDWVRCEKGSFYLVLTRTGEELTFKDRLPELRRKSRLYNVPAHIAGLPLRGSAAVVLLGLVSGAGTLLARAYIKAQQQN